MFGECVSAHESLSLFVPLCTVFIMCMCTGVTGNAVGVDGAFVSAVDSLLRVKCLHLTKSRTPTRTQAFHNSLLYKCECWCEEMQGIFGLLAAVVMTALYSFSESFHKWFYKGAKYQLNRISLLSSCFCRSVLCLIDCKPAGALPARARQMPGLTSEYARRGLATN